ncbi:hypothetical protein SaSA20_0603a [Streptococcus agalactiae]|nr:hypothetical protein SaSA20_0603a [Streptococcus agalactiae]
MDFWKEFYKKKELSWHCLPKVRHKKNTPGEF